jgi:hypothetical protein
MRRLDVALRGSAGRVAASLPRTSRKKRAFPPMSGGTASAGVRLVPTVPAPPPLSMRDLTRGEAPRAPSVAFCIVQGSVLPFGDAPCVCFNGRENRGRGRPVSAARKPQEKPRGTAMILHPCLQHGIREETECDRRGSKASCYILAPHGCIRA